MRGRRSIISGGSEESVVVSFAVQEALALLVAAVGVHAAAAPRFEPPLRNCTVPVGPCAELLLVLTVAVNVTPPPEETVVAVEVTVAVVLACVIVTDRELLFAFEL